MPIADGFAHRHDIGDNALCLKTPEMRAGAPEAHLYLVCNADAARVAHMPKRLSQIILRQHDLAAAAQQRLADERRYVVPSLLDMLDSVRNSAGIVLACLGVGTLVLPAIHIRHGNLV